MAELKKELRPEFINRIDDIIVFHKLNDSEINSIIDLLLKNVEERLQEQGLEIKIDKSVKELIAKKGIDKDFGARPLRRAIQNIVEDKLAEEIFQLGRAISLSESLWQQYGDVSEMFGGF